MLIYYSICMKRYIESLSACLVGRIPFINYEMKQEFNVIYNVL